MLILYHNKLTNNFWEAYSMKFHVFGIWERLVKPLIFILVLALTVVLIYIFFAIDRESKTYEMFIFIAPIGYALFLFFASIFLESAKRQVEGKLYEREGYFLTISRLRDVINATINNIDESDYSDIESKVLMFQMMTGRDEATINAISQGKKNPHCFVRENGFVYTSKMMKMETAALACINRKCNSEMPSNERPIISLIKYYNRCCKDVENNYIMLKKTYGGDLQHLVDYEDSISDFNFKADDIISKFDDSIWQLEELNASYKSLAVTIERIQEMINEFSQQAMERLDDIEDVISSLQMDHFNGDNK